jgi:phage gp36-like protein
MSQFIVKQDYGTSIRENILDAIIELDDEKLSSAEVEAIEFMKGYLNSRYDVAEIFNKEGIERNPIVLMYAKDITLYNLHSLINPKKIPDHRVRRFEAAVDWLNAVSDGRINPPDLPKPESDSKDYLLFGSNPKRSNHI